MLHFYFMSNVLFSQALRSQKKKKRFGGQADFFFLIFYISFHVTLSHLFFWVTMIIRHYTFYTMSELGLLASFTFVQRINFLGYALVRICRKKNCLIPFASALDPSSFWMASSLSNSLHIKTHSQNTREKIFLL